MIPLIIKSTNKDELTIYLKNEFQKSHGIGIERLEVIPEKKSLSIEEVRILRKKLYTKHPSKRLVLFWNFDTATTEAQNALLKVLEDSNNEYLFVMQVSRVESILSTIVSRSRIIHLDPVFVADLNSEVDSIVQSLEADNILQLLSHPLFQPKTREDASALLKTIIVSLRSIMKKDPGRYVPLIKKTLDFLFKLEVYNLNQQLVIDHWILTAKSSLKKN